MNKRQERGREIAEKEGSVVRVGPNHYRVKSQSGEESYDVIKTEAGWTCTCPDCQIRHVCCKHVHAVEPPTQTGGNMQKDVEIREVTVDSCRKCSSENIIKDGVRHNMSADVQRFKCNDCQLRFSGNPGFERMRATPDQITTAMNLYFNGESSRKTADSLLRKNIKVTHKTVQNWIKKYVGLMDKYLDQIVPQVGSSWRTDEIEIRIKRDKKFLYAMLDADTRFWLASIVAGRKGTDDVRPMLKDSKRLAKKVPPKFISDGAANFHEAWEDEYKPKNLLHPPSEHIRHIHMEGDTNNNQMESFNSNTLRLRLDATRGLKRTDSPVIAGLRIHHNFIRPHQGVKGNTPACMSKIKVMGLDKWKTIIQNAAKSLPPDATQEDATSR